MYGAIIDGRPSLCALAAVRDSQDLEWLVKEAEILTGRPGREFVVAGTERLAFRVAVGPSFCEVTCLDDAQAAFCKDVVPVEELARHVIGIALQHGQLFTPILN